MIARIFVRHEHPEDPTDLAAIRAIHDAAFGGTEESALVDRLRDSGAVLASLIATVDHRAVGHVLLSRMSIGTIPAVALAPLGVVPELHHHGIGGRLVHEGLELLQMQGERIVLVVGHPEYYARFGFSTEKARGIDAPFPREFFMALDLTPGALDGVRGQAHYPAAFGI